MTKRRAFGKGQSSRRRPVADSTGTQPLKTPPGLPVAHANRVAKAVRVADTDPLANADPVAHVDPVSGHDPVSDPDPVSNTDPVCNTDPVSNTDPVCNTDPVSDPAREPQGGPVNAHPKKSKSCTSVMTPPAMTRASFAVAHAVLESREQAAAAGVDIEDLEDVVIALNVTPEQLDQVPDEWFDGVEVELCTDGTLLALSLASNTCAGATAEVVRQVGMYADPNDRLDVESSPTLPLGASGQARPDVVLYATQDRVGGGERVAFAVFQVEPASRSGRSMVETADRCFTHIPTVACVVSFKFFPARRVRNALRVPALAVVFRRARVVDQHHRIEVDQIQSFGNEDIDAQGLAFLTAPNNHNLVANPSGNVRPLLAASTAFPDAFNVANLHESLIQALDKAHRKAGETAGQLTAVNFPVQVLQDLPAISVDLAKVFVRGVRAGAYQAVEDDGQDEQDDVRAGAYQAVDDDGQDEQDVVPRAGRRWPFSLVHRSSSMYCQNGCSPSGCVAARRAAKGRTRPSGA